LVHSEQPS